MKTAERKREEAIVRQERYNALTPIEKLTLINSRPGKSKRERARIEQEVTG